MISKAIKIDNRLYESRLERKGQAGRKDFHKANSGAPRKSSNYYGLQPMELDKLQKDQKRGQRKDQKKHLSKKPTKDKKDVTCYNCDKKGHYANKCRQPKKEKK
jgi:hypothetical protein